MDDAFRPDTAVLNLGPRAHVREVPIKKREYLLWPAWLYQVVAPRVRPRRLNALQKAVLGMCRSGVMRVDEVSVPLDIHPDLAAFICGELQRKCLLRTDRSVTSRGMDVLHEETIESQEMVTGYVFKDPLSGELWPRFVDRLDYCETNSTDADQTLVELGSTGRPFYRPAYRVIPPRCGLPSAPTSRDIIRAARRQHSSLGMLSPDDGDGESSVLILNEHIQRANVVSDRGEPVFLLTFLYSPSGEGCDGDWHASDPFGFGSSTSLRRSIEQALSANRGLKERVHNVLRNSLHDGVDAYVNWMEKMRHDCEVTVDSLLTLSIRRFAGYEDLLAMEIARKQAELSGSCSQESFRSIATAARCTLEAALKELAERYPLRGIWKQCYAGQRGRERPITDMGFLVAKYNSAASSIGLTTPLPTALSSVKPNHIRAVSDYGDSWRLRPLFLATILAARDLPEHPLRASASACPSLATDIDTVASIGGGASHHASTPVDLTSATTLTNTVYKLVGLLTGLADTAALTS